MAVVIPQVITEDRASSAEIFKSSYFHNGESQFFRTATAGNRKTWSHSTWIKRTEVRDAMVIGLSIQAGGYGEESTAEFNAAGSLMCFGSSNGSAWTTYLQTRSTFTDSDGWYHILSVLDTQEQFEEDRWRFYINGVRQYNLSSHTYPSLNAENYINSASGHSLCSRVSGGSRYKGYMTETYFFDGQAMRPEKFGYLDPNTNTWRPKKFVSGNDGTTFSSFLTSNTTITNPGNGFNGNPNDSVTSGTVNGNAVITFTPPTPIQGRIIEVRSYTANQTVSLNDGQESVVCQSGKWHVLSSNPTTIRKLTFTGPTDASSQASFTAIRVDGEYLKDNTSGGDIFGTNGFYLPMNNKSSVMQDHSGNNNHFSERNQVTTGNTTTLDKATGGIPILRTNVAGTQGGGVRTVCKNVVVTVVSTGEGNKYFFDGVRYSPGTYPLIRGGTYFFDQSDASNGGGGTHPLRFATAADAAGSTEYTDGVTQNGTPGQAGAYTKITVPHNAPDTLHYYCTNHGGMGGPTENTTDIRRADPFAWKCVLATPMTRQSQLNFQDESNILRGELDNANAKVITNNNGQQTTSLTQRDSNFYGHSARFDGSTTNIHHSIANNTDFDFGTEDFTIECWFKATGTGTEYLFGKNPSSFSTWSIYAGINPGTYTNDINMSVNIGGTNVFLRNQFYNDSWNHLAIVRHGNVLSHYINGSKGYESQYQDQACSGSYGNTTEPFVIGRAGSHTSNGWGDSTSGKDSYIQDFRIYKGVAKYTEEFTVPVTRPSTAPESPSGVAYGSIKPTKSGSWEPGFGGTGYIEYPASSDGDFTLDGDFTIECWFRSKKWNSNQNISIFGLGSQYTSTGILVFMDTVGRPQIMYNSSTLSFSTNYIESLCRFNCWHHFALTKSGSTTSVFLDGIRAGQDTALGTIGSASDKFILGSYYVSGNPQFQTPGMYSSWCGAANISNFRVIKGECLYTNHFEPPTAPYEVTANTKLLVCNNSENYYKCIRGSKLPNYGNASAYAMWPLDSDINDDSGNNRTLTENGGATTFISAPANNFGITNCATFTNNGKYLSYAVTPASEWTFDCYVYPVSATSAPYIFGWNGTSGSNCSLGMDQNPWNGGGGNGNSPINVFTWAIFGAPNLNTIKEVVFNQWHHIRITSSASTNLNLYVDGEHIGALPDDSTPASPITFGDVQSSRFNGHFAGVRYVEKDLGAPNPDNLEVTVNGVTSNTPPIGPSPHTSQLHPYSDASTNDPFVDDIRMLMGPETGHAVLSSQPEENSNGPQVMTKGNLTYDLASDSSAGYYRFFYSSLGIPPQTGRWYWEFELPGNDSNIDPSYSNPNFGLTNQYFGPTESSTVWGNQISMMAGSGYAQKYGYNGTWKMGDDVNVTGGIFGTPAGTMGMMYDSDTGDLTLYHNGEKSMTWDTLPTDRTYWPFWQNIYKFDNGGYPHNVNFGQHPFRFPPPHGAKTLCLTNLQRANKVAMNPDDHFTTITSWGNGFTGYSSSNVGLWSKDLISSNGTFYSDNSYGPCMAFDGTESTSVYASSNAAGEKLIFAPETPIYFHSGLEIKIHSASSAMWNGHYVNPGSISFATFTTGAGVISKDTPIIISTTNPGSSEPGFYCIRINGNILLNDVQCLKAAKTKFPKGLWWTKNRASADQNQLIDSIRGDSARSTCPATTTWGSVTYPPGQTVAWAWSAPEDFTGSSNTTCSRNLDAGFSMIKADAGVTTIQHGLSKAPDFIISAPDSSNNLFVHSVALSRYWGSTRYGTLDTSVAFGASDATIYDGNPTDTQFVVGSNMSTPACMHYCWHEVEGYCKTGVYRGSGTADGPYVNLGFMPRWILLRAVTRSGDWKIFDKVRDPQNPCTRRLNPNAQSVEGEEENVEFLSSGFKITSTLTDVNQSAETYIYLAFAAMPTSLPYAGQCDAR